MKEKQPNDDSYKVQTANTVMGVRSTVFSSNNYLDEKGNEVTTVITLDGIVAVRPNGADIATAEPVLVASGFTGVFVADRKKGTKGGRN